MFLRTINALIVSRENFKQLKYYVLKVCGAFSKWVIKVPFKNSEVNGQLTRNRTNCIEKN